MVHDAPERVVSHAVVVTENVASVVGVEAVIGDGEPGMAIQGVPDLDLSPLRDRVRAAVVNSGLAWPGGAISVTVSPPLRGVETSAVDVAVAVAVLASAGVVPARSLAGVGFVGQLGLVGELGLDGRLHPQATTAAVAVAARSGGLCVVLVPPAADDVPAESSAGVVEVADLGAVLAYLGRARRPVMSAAQAAPAVDKPGTPAARAAEVGEPGELRGPDVVGCGGSGGLDEVEQLGAGLAGRREVELAAAGGHHLLLAGPPGTSKPTLARWLARLLPDLDAEAEAEVAAIRRAAGTAELWPSAGRRGGFVAADHSSSLAFFLGTGRLPGALACAHRGVLLLQDAPEFSPPALHALLGPLDRGEVSLARGGILVQYPARLLVVLTAASCSCAAAAPGWWTDCGCTAADRRRYLGAIPTALLDRIDIKASLDPAPVSVAGHQPAEPTSVVAGRVAAARAAALARLHGTGWTCNADVPGRDLLERWPLPASVTAAADQARRGGLLSERGRLGVLRLAWTAADLAGRSTPTREDIAEAVHLRQGNPPPAGVPVGEQDRGPVGDAGAGTVDGGGK
jgi:magnesium chelatase family protein